jgi:prepilin-type N-terminal cleavage/methylation domain-containing protein
MKMFRKSEGFTLVELMVVVLIIGILVAIAIPVFNAAKANAQKKSCYANVRTIEGSAQTYQAEAGTLPAAGALSGSGNWLVPTYIKTTPFCPLGTAATTYYNIDASGTITGDQGATAGFNAAHPHS